MQLWRKWSTFTQSDWTKRHFNAVLCLTASFFFSNSVLKLKLNVSLIIQDEGHGDGKKKYEKGGKMLLHSHISIAFPKKLWARSKCIAREQSYWIPLGNVVCFLQNIAVLKTMGFLRKYIVFSWTTIIFSHKTMLLSTKTFPFSKLCFLIISFTKVELTVYYGNTNV